MDSEKQPSEPVRLEVEVLIDAIEEKEDDVSVKETPSRHGEVGEANGLTAGWVP